MHPHDHSPRGGSLLDSVAIGLSGLCLVHCLGTAVLLALVASAAGPLLDPRIHEIGLAIAILFAAVALVRGVVVHRQPLPIALGAGGLTLMSGGLMVPHGSAEIVLTMAGVALLASAHLANRRASQ